ncbi:MAG: hypothetical protein WC717_03435 [Candidatus Micrarchaeia archaeon]|jgi:hypothetical protein
MKIGNILSAKGLAFVMLFSLLVLAADSMNFSAILGGAANQSFTLFQFMGPVAGGFLGAGAGALSVLLAEVVSFFWLGKDVNIVNILRLAPMLFAAVYFAAYSRGKFAGALVSLACMAAFIAHPIGAQAWVYSLYWLIPAIALALPEHLFLRSLGSTFTAHSIGSVVWLYAFPSTAAFWLALIPIVAFERFMFASGISISYVALNALFARVEAVAKSGYVFVDRRYAVVPAKLK